MSSCVAFAYIRAYFALLPARSDASRSSSPTSMRMPERQPSIRCDRAGPPKRERVSRRLSLSIPVAQELTDGDRDAFPCISPADPAGLESSQDLDLLIELQRSRFDSLQRGRTIELVELPIGKRSFANADTRPVRDESRRRRSPHPTIAAATETWRREKRVASTGRKEIACGGEKECGN